jgi:8-oxo-dGTP pyrophosphatase MutT (NUDIX family)
MQADTSQRLVEIADQLRAIAQNGLYWAGKRHDEYDQARYDQVISLAARLLAIVDTRSPDEIERIFRGDLGMRSPLVGVSAAVFNDEGKILLTQRKDNGKWCMPGGLADVGEPPSAVAVREVLEETGLQVKATRLIGVYDARLSGSLTPLHLYHLDFLCKQTGGEPTLTNEIVAYGYLAENELASLTMHGSHAHRVPFAFKAYQSEHWECVFQ